MPESPEIINSKIEEGTPFRQELAPSEYDSYADLLRKIPNLPDKVIRVQSLERALSETKWRLAKRVSQRQRVREYLRHFQKGKKLFYDLRDKYGIAVPDIDLVLSNDETGEEKMFMIVDKIEGVNVTEAENFSPEAIPKFDAYFSGMFQYLIDTKKNRSPVLSDIGPLFQCVYGRRKRDAEDQIYLVDVEPLYAGPDEPYYNEMIEDKARDLEIAMEQMEILLGGIELKMAREKWKELSREIYS